MCLSSVIVQKWHFWRVSVTSQSKFVFRTERRPCEILQTRWRVACAWSQSMCSAARRKLHDCSDRVSRRKDKSSIAPNETMRPETKVVNELIRKLLIWMTKDALQRGNNWRGNQFNWRVLLFLCQVESSRRLKEFWWCAGKSFAIWLFWKKTLHIIETYYRELVRKQKRLQCAFFRL